MRSRALVVREQHRDVLAGPRSGEDDGRQSESLEPLQAGCATVAVGVDDEFGTARQCGVGDGVHVADDDVGPVTGLEQRIGAAINPDHHRPVLAKVGPKRREVLAVVVAANDDEDLPPFE